MLKDSYLEDITATLAKFRKLKGGSRFEIEDLAEMCLLLPPEFLQEFGRLQGGAVAVTGFNKDQEPEIAGVLLTGSSNIPSLALRAYLMIEKRTCIVDESEGVKIYGETKEADDEEETEPEAVGPCCAFMPGVIIAASSLDGVKDMIRRCQGKKTDPTLASQAAFKEAAKLRERAGLFGYADVPRLAEQLDKMMEKDKDSDDARQWSIVKELVNPKAFRYCTVSLTIQQGGIEWQAQAALVPGQTSPILEILPDKKANVELLHAVPKNALLALATTLPQGEERCEKLLQLADLVARKSAVDDENLPSKIAARAEAELKMRIGKALSGPDHRGCTCDSSTQQGGKWGGADADAGDCHGRCNRRKPVAGHLARDPELCQWTKGI